MLIKDFLKFLKEYNIVALALAFIMGAASTSLVSSLVKDIVMPILAPLISADAWRDAVLVLGPINIKYGSFLAEFLNFVVLALVVFIIAKKIFKEEKVTKK
jgi:large conductance mechanosensitive channel